MTTIRPAHVDDLDQILEIYNEAICNSTATFDIEPKTSAWIESWFDSHGPRHPILVADTGEAVAGWASLTRWSQKSAYDISAETTFYVKEGCRGRGIGRALKGAIIDEGRRLGYHSLIARVTSESAESLHLNRSFGFKHVGVLKEIGRKFDRLLDVHILQLILD